MEELARLLTTIRLEEAVSLLLSLEAHLVEARALSYLFVDAVLLLLMIGSLLHLNYCNESVTI